MSENNENSSRVNVGLAGATVAVFIIVTMSFFYVFNISGVDLSVNAIMSIISGVIVVWIILSATGILKEFSIRGGPFFELTSKIEDVRKENRESNKEICGKITNLNQNIQSINSRIDNVISNQLTASQTQSVKIYNAMEKEKINLDKEIEKGIKEYFPSSTFEPTKEKVEVPIETQKKIEGLLNRDRELKKLITKYFDKYPIDVEAELNKSMYYFNKEQYEKVIRILDRVLEEEPENLTAIQNKGVCLSRQKKWQESYEFVKKAYDIWPDNVLLNYNMGTTIHFLGRDKESIPYYEKAIKIDKKYDAAYYNLSCSYGLLGNKPLAFLNLKKAIKLNKKWIDFVKKDVDFKELRNDPNFLELVKPKNEN